MLIHYGILDECPSEICISCKGEYNGSHRCEVCKSPCHAMETCSKTRGEEGYGAAVICNHCNKTALSSSTSSTTGADIETARTESNKRKCDEKGTAV